MGGVCSRRPIEFARVARPVHLVEGSAKSVGKHSEFFSERRGCCWLTVGSRQHGHTTPPLRELREMAIDLLGFGKPHVADAALDHQRVGEVVDVLAGRRKMGEFP